MALLRRTFHRRGEIRARAVTVDHGLQTVTAEVADGSPPPPNRGVCPPR